MHTLTNLPSAEPLEFDYRFRYNQSLARWEMSIQANNKSIVSLSIRPVYLVSNNLCMWQSNLLQLKTVLVLTTWSMAANPNWAGKGIVVQDEETVCRDDIHFMAQTMALLRFNKCPAIE